MDGATHVPFAEGLTGPEAATLEELSIARSYPQGTPIFHEGDDPGQTLVLKDGRAKVTLLSATGREVILGFAGPGDLLGELSVLADRPRTATVTTLEPAEVMATPRAAFLAFLDRHPRVMRLMLTTALERLQEENRRQLEFAAQDTLGRIASRLVELCARFGEVDGGVVVIGLPLSQEELAAWSSSSREAVARALQTLRKLGAIETDRRRIKVVEPETLARYAIR
jgi:CRP/FNR family cyclic AMP-dependent transcriptional regulator